MSRFTFSSKEGEGFAIQCDGGPWRIYAPWGSQRFIGTKEDAIRHVKKVGGWAGKVKVKRNG